jgi:hypothetical protein
MYKQGPTKEDRAVMNMFGLTEDDYVDESVVEVWQDNWDAILLFDALGSQWRVGSAGPYGLDYNVLYHKMDRMNLTPERYDELEEEIRILEAGALEEMRKE